MKDDKENFYNKFNSGKPPNLSPEEEAAWEEEQAWEQQEKKRREEEGYYTKRTGGSKKKKNRIKFKRGGRTPTDMKPFHEM